MNWKRILIGRWSWWRPLQSLAFIYLLLACFAVFFADALIFMPPPASYQPGSEHLLELQTGEGESITVLHLKAAAGQPTLLYSHGNAEDLGDSRDLYTAWHAMGLGVAAYDYPGYGHSTGKPTEASCQRAVRAVWDHLVGSGVPPSSIVLVGRSVGSGPATWLASREKSAGLVLIAPFTSAFAVRFPGPILPGDRFRNLDLIRRIDTPLLIIHGLEDSIISPSHGGKLHAASPASDKTLRLIETAGHNNLFAIAGDEILAAIHEFSQRVIF
jgi:alpha-beta hydrolase superfamily lysophospholipase